MFLGHPEEYDKFEVLSLSKLFLDMKNNCFLELYGKIGFQKLIEAETELKVDTYTYNQWITCIVSLSYKLLRKSVFSCLTCHNNLNLIYRSSVIH